MLTVGLCTFRPTVCARIVDNGLSTLSSIFRLMRLRINGQGKQRIRIRYNTTSSLRSATFVLFIFHQLANWKPIIHRVSKKCATFIFYDNFGKRAPIFIIFFTVKFRKGSAENVGIKINTSPQTCCLTTLWKVSGQLYRFTAQLIEFKVMQMFSYGKCSQGMLCLWLSTKKNYLFNAVPNGYLHNWKE